MERLSDKADNYMIMTLKRISDRLSDDNRQYFASFHSQYAR